MTTIEITQEQVTVEVAIQETVVSVEGAGPAGPQGVMGATGAAGPVELYDSATPPGSPTFPYLRVVRDGAGDPQSIHLGTVT